MFRLSAIALILFVSMAALGQSYPQDIARDSARSDKRTGGTIRRAQVIPGAGDVRISINLPSFQMTLWQGDKEIGSYSVGIGLADYPVAVSLRSATSIDWNPVWIPPSSDWIEKSSTVKPGEIVEPTDPRNPLGKIKIPLGYGYLIHQAKGVGDLGNLVSHGCIRVLQRDLYDLADKIAAARSLPITPAMVTRARRTKAKMSFPLDPVLPVEITYDTIVMENGKLNIYADVYGYRKNTVDNLRKELSDNGIDDSRFSNAALKRMLSLAKPGRKYAITSENLNAGRSLGSTLPVLATAAR